MSLKNDKVEVINLYVSQNSHLTSQHDLEGQYSPRRFLKSEETQSLCLRVMAKVMAIMKAIDHDSSNNGSVRYQKQLMVMWESVELSVVAIVAESVALVSAVGSVVESVETTVGVCDIKAWHSPSLMGWDSQGNSSLVTQVIKYSSHNDTGSTSGSPLPLIRRDEWVNWSNLWGLPSLVWKCVYVTCVGDSGIISGKWLSISWRHRHFLIQDMMKSVGSNKVRLIWVSQLYSLTALSIIMLYGESARGDRVLNA